MPWHRPCPPYTLRALWEGAYTAPSCAFNAGPSRLLPLSPQARNCLPRADGTDRAPRSQSTGGDAAEGAANLQPLQDQPGRSCGAKGIGHARRVWQAEEAITAKGKPAAAHHPEAFAEQLGDAKAGLEAKVVAGGVERRRVDPSTVDAIHGPIDVSVSNILTIHISSAVQNAEQPIDAVVGFESPRYQLVRERRRARGSNDGGIGPRGDAHDG